MLVFRIWPSESTRSPDRPCYWMAEVTLPDGRAFTNRSRYDAANGLARRLVAEGVPDSPVEVYDVQPRSDPKRAQLYATTPILTYRSFHKGMAPWTFREGNQPIYRSRWQPRPENIAYGVFGKAQNRGEEETEVGEAAG